MARTVRATMPDICTIAAELPTLLTRSIFRTARQVRPGIVGIARSDGVMTGVSDPDGPDIEVVGVGEDAFIRLCDALAQNQDPSGVPDIVCRDGNGRVRRTPPRSTVTRLMYDVVSKGTSESGEDLNGLDAHVHRTVTAQWAPRDEAAALDFVRDHLPGGRIMIYGAGTHTARLLDVLADRPDVTVLAVLDRNASGTGTFRSHPLLPPLAARQADVDHVVVAHPVWELDMVEALLRHGVPLERLFQVYSSPAYLARVLIRSVATALATLDGGIRNLVIGPAKWSIVSDAELAEALPPDQTVKLHFDPTDPFVASRTYRTIDLRHSYALLDAVIRHVRPATIYLRTHVGSNLLGYVIRRMAPQARLIHELYDFASLLSDQMLFGWMERSPEAVAACRATERHSMRHSDLIVSKRAGPSWQPFLERFTAPYRVFYAGKAAQPPSRPPPSPGRPIRILYAGILPRPELLDVSLCDYNFLPLLEALAATGRFEIALYNYLHEGSAMDYLFSGYLERFSTPALRYHRCVAYEALVELAGQFDYGWLYRDATQEDNPDARIIVGQRFTGYVFAGLPQILDEGWESMADLVRRHGAGLVVSHADQHRLADIITAADHAALAAGAQHLREAMIEHNQAVLHDIAGLAAPAVRDDGDGRP
ncbi:hypothetical protein GCM10007856_34820 [Azospirillum oryzae]|nr:hypothetical protein GCM10007856_34820 [Azospirillum oryzae]